MLERNVIWTTFENETFCEELLYQLLNATFDENGNGCEEFIDICQ